MAPVVEWANRKIPFLQTRGLLLLLFFIALSLSSESFENLIKGRSSDFPNR